MKNKFSLLILSILLVSCSSTTQVVSNDKRPTSSLQYYTNRAYTASHNTDNNIIIYEANKLDSSSEQKLKNIAPNVSIKNVTDDHMLISTHGYDVFLSFLNGSNNVNKELKYDKPFELLTGFWNLDGFSQYNGIINMSFGYNDYYSRITKNDKYINNKSDFKSILGKYPYFSSYLTNDGYTKNNQLKVIALGNSRDDFSKDKTFNPNGMHAYYENMSSEIQKAARSEVIFVGYRDQEFEHNKIKIEGKDYGLYTADTSIPYLLRSNTVITNGTITHEGYNHYGSSFATPFVSRLAYDLKEKYPFLNYHQIKQIILTTATREDGNKDYLSNTTGWGLVEYDKARKGFGMFNAGLVEEQLIFEDNGLLKDKDNNLYQYINIPDNQYEFSNDIYGGLNGKSNKEVDQLDYKTFKLQLPKILDSEVKFYESAGLRKDGKGKLILSGKQHYDKKTQILDGELELKNDSSSNYEVYKNATLTLNKDDIEIKDITNEGTVKFLSNLTMHDYKGLKDSNTYLSKNKKIKANSFSLYNAKISLVDSGIINDENIKEYIDSENIKLNDVNLNNVYLELVQKNNEYTVIDSSDSKYLSNLTDDEKRNLPTYIYNEKTFLANADRSILPTILSEGDKIKTKKDIFTDNYASYINDIIDFNFDISNIDNDNSKISFLTKYQSNIFESDKYEGYIFNSNTYKIMTNFNNFYTNINYSKLNHEFSKNTFDSNIYSISTGYRFKNITNQLTYSKILTQYNRYIDSKKIDNNLDINILTYSIMLDKVINYNKFDLIPSITYQISNTNIQNSKENNDMGIEILKQNKVNNKILIDLGIRKNITDNIQISNKIGAKINLNTDNKLDIRNIEQKTQIIGKKNNRFSLSNEIAIKYIPTENINLQINSMIDTNRKFSIQTKFGVNW